MVMLFDAKAQAATDKESARVFVQKFYDWYAVMDADDSFTKKHNVSPFYHTVKSKPAYFDKPLLNALKAYFDPANKVKEPGLDFDPITSAQDTRSGFQTGNVKQVGNKFLVDLHDLPKGKSAKEILASETFLIVEAVKVGKDWKLANFIYPAESKTKQTDLLEVLAHQKK
jgi:hypothetical protein